MTNVAAVDQTGALALRAATAAAHHEVEHALGLPASIRDGDDYLRWLARFFGIYAPLEELLGQFSDWPRWNIQLHEMGHTAALRHDLAALEFDLSGIDYASATMLPSLPTFAEALGALYVLEGSKLGGRYILMDLSARLPNQIAHANHFFSGNGAESGSRWNAFQSSLNRYCLEQPEDLSSVISGADATFHAIGAWMSHLGDTEMQAQGEMQ